MLITKDFIFIHMPKTGGTFVSTLLKEIYPDSIEMDKHGTCSDIAEEYQQLPVVSIFRNPFDRYVSQYHYGWGKRHIELYCGAELLEKENVQLDSVSFDEFVRLANTYFKGYYKSKSNGFNSEKIEEHAIGWHTEQYFRFYFRNAKDVFNGLTHQSIEEKEFLKNAFKVHFLYTHTLNADLFNYLQTHGHGVESIKHILQKEKILPEGGEPRLSKDSWKNYYDSDTYSYVSDRERVLFSLHDRVSETLR